MEDNTVSPPVDFWSPCVLSPDQLKWLQDLQVEFVDILTGTGSISIPEYAIDTGETNPLIGSLLYYSVQLRMLLMLCLLNILLNYS